MRVNRAGQEERARKTDVVRPIGRGDDARDAPIRRVDGETCLHASASVDEIGKEAHRRWILPRPCVLPQYDAAYAQRGARTMAGRPGQIGPWLRRGGHPVVRHRVADEASKPHGLYGLVAV